MVRNATPKYSRVAPARRRAELIEAGIRCLAARGLAGFTVSQICAEAGVSPGLIIHHFGSKDALLTAIYETMLERLISSAESAVAEGKGPTAQLDALLAASFPETPEGRSLLRVWLALWGEIASNPDLLKAHRRQYRHYHEAVAAAVTALHPRAKPAARLRAAKLLIALIDGLWLEWCIDPEQIAPETARAACLDFVRSQFRSA